MSSPLCKTLLRHARDGGGAIKLKEIRDTAMGSVASNGRIMISASAGGKAYSYITGLPLEKVIDALDEAEGIYASYDSEQLANLLDRAPIRTARASFRCTL